MSQLDKQRLKSLLEDTVTMVCKSSLVQQKFTVEGLLGITLENDDVLLININKTIAEEDSSKEDDEEGVVTVSPEPVKRKMESDTESTPIKKERPSPTHNRNRKDDNDDISEGNLTVSRTCLPTVPNPFWTLSHPPMSQLASFGAMATWAARPDLAPFSEATTVSINLPPSSDKVRRTFESTNTTLPSIPALVKNGCHSTSQSSEQTSQQQHTTSNATGNVSQPSAEKLSSSKNLSRKFHCTQCLRSFTDRHNLENHIRTHTGEKPYRCEICGKNFSKKGNMEQHMWTHSEAKPYTCTICNQGFIRKDYLSKHMERHGTRMTVSEQQTTESQSNDT